MKIVSLLSALFFYSMTYGQTNGNYHGKEYQSTYYPNNSKKSIKIYNHKQISLNPDSTFIFWFAYRTSNETCEGCPDTIYKTGKWTKHGDTICLNSKYNINDYVSINELSDSTNKTRFIYKPYFMTLARQYLIINNNQSFNLNPDDTITIDKTIITSIKFETESTLDCSLVFNYKPKNKSSNIFILYHPKLTNDQIINSFIVNKKFILKENKLIPIDNSCLMKVDEWFEK